MGSSPRLLRRSSAIVAAPAESVQPDMFIVGAKTEQNKMKKRRRRRNKTLPSSEQRRRHDVTYLDTIRGLEGKVVINQPAFFASV